MSRKLAREIAMKVLFQLMLNKDDVDSTIEQVLAEEVDNIQPKNRDYLINVVKKTTKELRNIDDYLEEYSENWRIDRMGKVDLSLMRLAVCEILYFDDIPVRVSINEAVELSKKFSSDKAAKYINGLLDKIANSYQE